MDFEIVDKPAFKVVGKATRVSIKDGGSAAHIGQFWQECVNDGTLDLLEAKQSKSAVIGDVNLGVCSDFADDMSEFTYTIAVESSAAGDNHGLVELAIPVLTWAVFAVNGPVMEAIPSLWAEIWSDFLPKSAYAHAVGPDIEAYPPGNPADPQYRCALWVPVVKK